MAIDATVGGVASNSYVTLAEADAYFEGRHPNAAWTALDDPAKEDALLTAARRLEQERYRGVPTNPLTGTSTTGATQALSFPRQGVVSRDGWVFSDDIIPGGVKRAQYEAAWALVTGDLQIAETGLEGFDSARVGPLEVEVRHQRKAGALPEAVRRELAEFLRSTSPTVPLVRA